MGIIEGGVVLPGAVPRHVNPFGFTRYVNGGTIQAAVDQSKAGDVIYIAPATYAENVVITTAGLTLVGLGARGEAWINPAAGIALHINAVNDIVVINLGIGGVAAAAAALRITSSSESRFHACKIEGGSDVLALVEGTAGAQCGNLMFFDCEFAWGLVGMEFDDSLFGYPTQILLRDCWFHEVTTAHIRINAAAGGVRDLWVEGCKFMNSEDATEPTDYILVDRVGDTGMVSNCYFAAPTITAAKMTIAAGILWVANKAEDGVSTARP
jgi:polygalacturonase